MTRGGSYLMAAPMSVGAAITIVLELFCPSIIYWLLLATSPHLAQGYLWPMAGYAHSMWREIDL
ncbi:hypothetical protein KTAU_00640 [Thermogemmatispora aurantia]|jgi:hypothetical protein|uniref:Uncharacterized protein n=1 Tax=Thermogemmatispora aurantia TaxID=2045279 RepID=A0A5J4K0E7_9CHLR|nr:hypothetical protein [Thermogemmatispora aurantia]GER81425.1 hypothetical protein KTAU_00640 [Thermogemmatispora aurantia]